MGDRFLEELYERLEHLKSKGITITKISFVGYSLGGLVSRYMIGQLYEVGFFDDIKPIYFTTFATPHLGVHFFNAVGPVLNNLGKILLGKSGRDLLGASPMLMDLCEGKYIEGLKLFEQRYLLANVRHDRTVAFYTSYIADKSLFSDWDQLKLKFLKGIPEIAVDGVKVKPKLIDFKNSTVRSKWEPLPKVTFRARLRYLGVLLLIGMILPIWFPLVVVVNCVGSILSWARLRFHHSEFDLVSHEMRRKAGAYSGASSSAAANSSSYSSSSGAGNSSASDSSAGISEEIAGITEEAVETMFEATKRNEDLSSSASLFASDDKTQDSVDVDFKALCEYVKSAKSEFDNTLFLDNKTTLFNEESISVLPFDSGRAKMMEALNDLQWFKMAVYVDVLNAHAGLIARRGMKTSLRGVASIYFWVAMIKQQEEKEKY